MGAAQLVEQPVQRERLVVRRARGVDEVAVHVPLEEPDLVLVEQREQCVAHVLVRVRAAQVEHLLVPPRRRVRGAAAQHPVGMGASQV